MNRWKIEWTIQALRDIEALDRTVAKRVLTKLESIAADPHRALRRLKDSDYHRMRVGDYRVIALLSAQANTVIVQRVGHRRSFYDEL